jgi:hypothetical protein
MAAAEELERRHAILVRRLDGRVESIETPRAPVREERVLRVERPYGPIATCGDFLLHVLGALRDGPPYLPRADAARHATMVRELFAFQPDAIAPRKKRSVAALPVAELDWAVGRWVDSFLGRGAGPLLVSYALDAAGLLAAFAYGARTYEGEAFRVVGLLEGESDAGRGFRCLHDARLKKDVSERAVKGALTIARVPDGVCVPETPRHVALDPGDEFVFVLDRCHLSQAIFDESPEVELGGPPPPFQWTQFVFDGHVLMTDAGDGRLRPWLPGEELVPRRWGRFGAFDGRLDLRTRLHGRWLTHEVRLGERDPFAGAERTPGPNWGADERTPTPPAPDERHRPNAPSVALPLPPGRHRPRPPGA